MEWISTNKFEPEECGIVVAWVVEEETKAEYWQELQFLGGEWLDEIGETIDYSFTVTHWFIPTPPENITPHAVDVDCPSTLCDGVMKKYSICSTCGFTPHPRH